MKRNSCFVVFTTKMTTLTLFFSSLFLSMYTALCMDICWPASCGLTVPVVRFPFRLKDLQTDRCGYPGFDLSCNNQSQTILSLPSAGEFIVNYIDYSIQKIYINDPDFCLPKRVLNFSLSGTPFKGAYSRKYTFFNCSGDWSGFMMYGSVPIFCLGSDNNNYSVIAMPSNSFSENGTSSCRNISTASVPVQLSVDPTSMNPRHDLQLTWTEPSCRSCEAAGGICGFNSDTGMDVGCFNLPSTGLPRSAKYGIIIGVGIPGIVCLLGLVCYTCSRIRTYGQGRQLDAEVSSLTINRQPMVVMTGLDGPTIESYPKTVLGESRRLPKPNDGTCPICLAEYQPKETLRTMPECNHYFHANCVDEWLKMNGTCPLCRNSPAGSSVVTPCSSVLSSSLSSSSS